MWGGEAELAAELCAEGGVGVDGQGVDEDGFSRADEADDEVRSFVGGVWDGVSCAGGEEAWVAVIGDSGGGGCGDGIGEGGGVGDVEGLGGDELSGVLLCAGRGDPSAVGAAEDDGPEEDGVEAGDEDGVFG